MNPHGVEVRRQGDVVVARLEGEIDLANTPIVSARILEALTNDALGLVLDLSEVRYIDSVGIQMLFTFVRSLQGSRQGMTIAIPPDSPVRRLLKVTQLDEATEFRDSLDEAIVALRERGSPQY